MPRLPDANRDEPLAHPRAGAEDGLDPPDGAAGVDVGNPAALGQHYAGPDGPLAVEEQPAAVLPGRALEMQGFFRISLTATHDMIDRPLPVFADPI